MDRRIVVVLNDLHCGNELAILNPASKIWRWDTENKRKRVRVEPNPVQSYLWKVFQSAKKGLIEFAGKDRIDVIANGDLTDGGIFGGKTTKSPNNQVIMAVDVLDEIVGLPNAASLRIASSTGVHAFDENSADTQIVDSFNDKYPDKDVAMVEHGLLNIGGVVVDYAHHGPGGGSRQWLKGNLLYLYSRDIIHQSHDDGQPLPDIILRAHKHERVQIQYTAWFGDVSHTVYGFTVPSWQLLTPYARKVTQSTPKVTNGILAIEVIDGEVSRPKWFSQTRYVRTAEEM